MRNRIEFFLDGAETERYHTIRTLQRETVGHHSHGVAMFVVLMGGGEEVLRAALYHDLAEHILGDIPSPAKKKYGIGEQVNELEDQLLKSVGFGIALGDRSKRILKFADIFQGMSFCTREVKMGNTKLASVFYRYKTYAEELMPCGVEREIFDALLETWNER
jgi:5'-deoxynucleotidase YfbR-like HD superfamily hydrolase